MKPGKLIAILLFVGALLFAFAAPRFGEIITGINVKLPQFVWSKTPPTVYHIDAAKASGALAIIFLIAAAAVYFLLNRSSSPPATVHFQPRWKEELVCAMDGKEFILEMPMGIVTVYFPTEQKWRTSVPEWAKNQWQRVHNELIRWGRRQNIPIRIDQTATVSFAERS